MKGEGGYCLAPGAHGYELLSGDLAAIPDITSDEREILLATAPSFTEIVDIVPVPQSAHNGPRQQGDGLRPGDDYNQRGDWRGVVESDGWNRLFTRDGVEYWQRPGKEGRGWSATSGHDGHDGLYVFSANAHPFQAGRGYTPFTIYTLLEHGGDYRAAAKALAEAGYGETRRAITEHERQTAAPAAPGPASSGPTWRPLPPSAYLSHDLARGASPWLNAYIAFSRKWSPRAYDGFHEASGLWVLSTVAAHRVSTDLGRERYTNLYILLASRTSLWAKLITASIGMDTLRAAGLDFLLAPDEATPEAFLDSLSAKAMTEGGAAALTDEQRVRRENRLAFAGQKGWYYEEFGQLMGGMMKKDGHMAAFRGLLRKFDDCPPSHEYKTRTRGDVYVGRPYLALLANITPADLLPYAHRGASLWNDGFWARFGFVSPPPDPNPGRGRFPSGKRIIEPDISQPLQEWHKRLGTPLVLPDPAGGTVQISNFPTHICPIGADIEDRFYAYHDGLSDLVQESTVYDFDGSYTRFAEKALRIAVLLASLENDGVIEMRHWARAQEITERWRHGLHELYDAMNNPRQADDEGKTDLDRIITLIRRLGVSTPNEIARNWRGKKAADIAPVMAMAAEDGVLVVVEMTNKDTPRYGLPGN